MNKATDKEDNIMDKALLQQRVEYSIKKAKEAGSLGCALCPAMSGVHRISLRKVELKDKDGKLKKVYICNLCIERIKDKHGKDAISSRR